MLGDVPGRAIAEVPEAGQVGLASFHSPKGVDRRHRPLDQSISPAARMRVRRVLRASRRRDPVTGLPGVEALLDTIAAMGGRAPGRVRSLALLIVDIDHFGDLCDAFGTCVGDSVLSVVSNRACGVVRQHDLAFRVGPDEIAVLCVDVDDPAVGREIAGRILDAVSGKVFAGNRVLSVSASVGVAIAVLAEEPELTPSLLLHRAVVAQHAARARWPSGIAVYDRVEQLGRQNDYALSTDLPAAVDNGELHLVWHPLVAHDGGEPFAEALLRWGHPLLGEVAPNRFIPLAEAHGHIEAVGEWVLGEACRQARAWFDRGDGPAAITVNVSPHQIDDRFDVKVASALHASGMDPRRLVLEITETADHDRLVESSAVLNRVRRLQVRIACDDFGVGSSSLARLRQLPIDIIKLDRSFVKEIDTDDRSLTIVGGVITTCHSLGVEVVAEGVETPAQLQTLQMLGCDRTQGFFWTTPLGPSDLLAWLAAARDGASG